MSFFRSIKAKKKYSNESTTTVTAASLSHDVLSKIDPNQILLLRIIVIGESSTGKTSLMTRFVDDKFSHSHISTVGIDFKMKKIKVKYSANP